MLSIVFERLRVVLLGCLIVVSSTSLRGQVESTQLEGTYDSKANGFEWGSRMILTEGHRFVYTSWLGGCRVEVKGFWSLEGKTLRFVNDPEFLEGSALKDSLHAVFPDMSAIDWSVRKNGIKPRAKLKVGFCFQDDKVHLRRSN